MPGPTGPVGGYADGLTRRSGLASLLKASIAAAGSYHEISTRSGKPETGADESSDSVFEAFPLSGKGPSELCLTDSPIAYKMDYRQ
jgi:hypothetical protein